VLLCCFLVYFILLLFFRSMLLLLLSLRPFSLVFARLLLLACPRLLTWLWRARLFFSLMSDWSLVGVYLAESLVQLLVLQRRLIVLLILQQLCGLMEVRWVGYVLIYRFHSFFL
jgi:hypothetical protein